MSTNFLGGNQMAQAIVDAKLAPCVSRRIFNYIKDHPGRNAKAIGLALKLPSDSASSVISKMERRKMLRSENVRVKTTDGATRFVKHYTTDIKEYELLPMPKSAPELLKPIHVPPPVYVPPVERELLVAPMTGKEYEDEPLHRFVDSLTVRQAVIIHRRLKALFRD